MPRHVASARRTCTRGCGAHPNAEQARALVVEVLERVRRVDVVADLQEVDAQLAQRDAAHVEPARGVRDRLRRIVVCRVAACGLATGSPQHTLVRADEDARETRRTRDAVGGDDDLDRLVRRAPILELRDVDIDDLLQLRPDRRLT